MKKATFLVIMVAFCLSVLLPSNARAEKNSQAVYKTHYGDIKVVISFGAYSLDPNGKHTSVKPIKRGGVTIPVMASRCEVILLPSGKYHYGYPRMLGMVKGVWEHKEKTKDKNGKDTLKVRTFVILDTVICEYLPNKGVLQYVYVAPKPKFHFSGFRSDKAMGIRGDLIGKKFFEVHDNQSDSEFSGLLEYDAKKNKWVFHAYGKNDLQWIKSWKQKGDIITMRLCRTINRTLSDEYDVYMTFNVKTKKFGKPVPVFPKKKKK